MDKIPQFRPDFCPIPPFWMKKGSILLLRQPWTPLLLRIFERLNLRFCYSSFTFRVNCYKFRQLSFQIGSLFHRYWWHQWVRLRLANIYPFLSFPVVFIALYKMSLVFNVGLKPRRKFFNYVTSVQSERIFLKISKTKKLS